VHDDILGQTTLQEWRVHHPKDRCEPQNVEWQCTETTVDTDDCVYAGKRVRRRTATFYRGKLNYVALTFFYEDAKVVADVIAMAYGEPTKKDFRGAAWTNGNFTILYSALDSTISFFDENNQAPKEWKF